MLTSIAIGLSIVLGVVAVGLLAIYAPMVIVGLASIGITLYVIWTIHTIRKF